MAKVIEPGSNGDNGWRGKIRCAHPVFGSRYRVDGCFAVIEITLDDIKAFRDYEGDWTFSVICPACGQKLYPEWQIGQSPLDQVKNRLEKKSDFNKDGTDGK